VLDLTYDGENGTDTISVVGVGEAGNAIAVNTSETRRSHDILQPEILPVGNQMRGKTEQRELRLVHGVLIVVNVIRVHGGNDVPTIHIHLVRQLKERVEPATAGTDTISGGVYEVLTHTQDVRSAERVNDGVLRGREPGGTNVVANGAVCQLHIVGGIRHGDGTGSGIHVGRRGGSLSGTSFGSASRVAIVGGIRRSRIDGGTAIHGGPNVATVSGVRGVHLGVVERSIGHEGHMVLVHIPQNGNGMLHVVTVNPLVGSVPVTIAAAIVVVERHDTVVLAADGPVVANVEVVKRTSRDGAILGGGDGTAEGLATIDAIVGTGVAAHPGQEVPELLHGGLTSTRAVVGDEQGRLGEGVKGSQLGNFLGFLCHWKKYLLYRVRMLAWNNSRRLFINERSFLSGRS